MTGPDVGAVRPIGRILLAASLVLVIASAVVFVIGRDDAGMLRWGLLGALWAALLAAFGAARVRREAAPDDAPGREDDLRTIYRLELEREVQALRAQLAARGDSA